ncbi:MAG: cation diffusion facilitator family transporter [Elusimicrobia bacterium]|nr:cation diffusion facilitator family transporter [Elusimicrobiota bacterium]
MTHAHPSSHAHPHHGRLSAVSALSWALGITGVFFLVELVGGWLTGSLALVSDALHMGFDMTALGLGLFAAQLGRRPADPKRTFGYKRVEVLAALLNGVFLILITGVILREAWSRWLAPRPILAVPMLAVAVVGLLANLAAGAVLYRSSRSNINLHGAFLHVLSDALGSLGVIAAAAVIMATGWQKVDSLVSALICVGIVVTAYWLVRDSVHILLEGVPAHLELEAMRSALGALPGVRSVHDLHLWSVTRGTESMSGHVVVESDAQIPAVLRAGARLVREKFGITHVTLQVETSISPECDHEPPPEAQ